MVAHEDGCWMPVNVSEERLLTAVLHFDWSSGDESEQATMHLQADVFAAPECAANTAEREANLCRLEIEARRNLFLVFVQPLRGDEQFDAVSVVVGECQGGFETEEGLVLHADLVRAFDDNLTDEVLITAHDALATNDVSVRVDL
jgi:hypothetical protein